MLKLGDFFKLEDGTRAKVIKTFNTSWHGNQVTYVTDNKQKLSQYETKLGKISPIRKTKTLDKLFKSFADIEQIKVRDKYIKPNVSMYFGSDPEIFVVNKNTKEVIPAFNFLRGKDKPNLIVRNDRVSGGEGEPIFWDGFQAEFNAKADTCFGWLSDALHNGLQTLDSLAKKHNPDAKLTIKSTLDIPIDMLMESKDEHVEFGCMPSLNAYGMSGLKMDGRDVPFRSAGGHIHFGLTASIGKLTTEKANKYVKALDKILGVACVSLFAGYDDPKRRELYGLAGEYRMPAHGLEYRTLSNAWLCHPLIFNMVFELARKVVVLEHDDLLSLWKTTEEETIECINKCDVKLARKILKRNKIMFKAILESINVHKYKAMYEVYVQGMDAIIDNTDDVIGNWTKGYIGHGDGTGHQIRTMDCLPKYATLVKASSEKSKSKTA